MYAEYENIGFSPVKTNLEAALQLNREQLPIVAKTCGNLQQTDIISKDGHQYLVPGSILLLERQTQVQFTHVRILKFHNDVEIKTAKGVDFLDERNKYVGQEFLVPVNYPGKVKIVNRPGKKQHYISVAQVIDDLPHYLKVDEDVMTDPPENMGHRQMVPANTELRVKGIVSPHYENHQQYLQCTDGKKEYLFRENCKKSFTAISDSSAYSLHEVVNDTTLPTVVEFQDIHPRDVVHYSDAMASTVHILMAGPLEILGIAKRTLLVGRTEKGADDQSKNIRMTVLIRNESLKKVFVGVKMFASDLEKSKYIENTFETSEDSSFIDDKLYVMQESPFVTLLRDPNDNGGSLYDFSDSDNDSSLYEVPSPPQLRRSRFSESNPDAISRNTELDIPEYQAQPIPQLKTPTMKPKMKKDILEMVVQKSKLGFNHAHKELKKVFKAKYDKSSPRKSTPAVYSRSTSEETVQTKDKTRAVVSRSKSEISSSFKKNMNQPGNRHSNINRQLPPLPPLPPVAYADITDDSTITDRKSLNKNLSRRKELTTARKNQTSEDFYQYSVTEVCDCFQMCALEKLANICLKERIDGPFLKSLQDLDCLKEDPFCLTNFEIRKLNRIINDGWRPKESDNS